MDKNEDIEVLTGTGNEKMIEEINKVLTEQSAAPLTPEELEKYKSQFEEYLKVLRSKSDNHNSLKSRLTIGQKKQRKAKRRISNKSRKINQEKNRHNKFTK